MIDLDRLTRWLLFTATMCAGLIAGWLVYENHTLITANSSLVEMLDEQLSIAEERIAVLEGVQSDVMTALTRGSVAADSILRDKK